MAHLKSGDHHDHHHDHQQFNQIDFNLNGKCPQTVSRYGGARTPASLLLAAKRYCLALAVCRSVCLSGLSSRNDTSADHRIFSLPLSLAVSTHTHSHISLGGKKKKVFPVCVSSQKQKKIVEEVHSSQLSVPVSVSLISVAGVFLLSFFISLFITVRCSAPTAAPSPPPQSIVIWALSS